MRYSIEILGNGHYYHSIFIDDLGMAQYASSLLRFGNKMGQDATYDFRAMRLALSVLDLEEFEDSAYISISFSFCGISYPIWRGEYFNLRRRCNV